MATLRTLHDQLRAALQSVEGMFSSLARAAPGDNWGLNIVQDYIVESRPVVDGAVYDSMKSLLERLRADVNRLAPGGVWGSEVSAGFRDFSSWRTLFDATKQNLGGLAQDLGAELAWKSRFFSEVVEPTIAEAGDVAREAAAWGTGGLVLVVVALLLLVVLVKF